MAKKTIIFLAFFFGMIFLVEFFSFLRCHYWLSTLDVDRTLNPLEVFNILITSTVTISVAWYISKKITEQRFEKELLIGDLKQVEKEVHSIEDIINNSDTIDVNLVLLKIGSIRNNIDRFESTVEILNLKGADTIDLNKSFNNLYSFSTDVDSIIVKSDTIDLAEINRKCSDVVVKTRKLLFQINKN